jgi:hypothetical protein
LQERLAARADNERRAAASAPDAPRMFCERACVRELAAARPVDADKIRIAKITDSRRAVAFKPAPQIAPCKSQKDRRPACLRALAL